MFSNRGTRPLQACELKTFENLSQVEKLKPYENKTKNYKIYKLIGVVKAFESGSVVIKTVSYLKYPVSRCRTKSYLKTYRQSLKTKI